MLEFSKGNFSRKKDMKHNQFLHQMFIAVNKGTLTVKKYTWI